MRALHLLLKSSLLIGAEFLIPHAYGSVLQSTVRHLGGLTKINFTAKSGTPDGVTDRGIVLSGLSSFATSNLYPLQFVDFVLASCSDEWSQSTCLCVLDEGGFYIPKQ